MSKYYHHMSEVEDLITWPDYKIPMKEFIARCTGCGGNWAAMFMTGIEACFPEIYKSLPDDGTFDGILLMEIVSRVVTQD